MEKAYTINDYLAFHEMSAIEGDAEDQEEFKLFKNEVVIPYFQDIYRVGLFYDSEQDIAMRSDNSTLGINRLAFLEV